MGKFIGPGYVRVGPVTAGVFGVGCLIPILTILFVLIATIGVLL